RASDCQRLRADAVRTGSPRCDRHVDRDRAGHARGSRPARPADSTRSHRGSGCGRVMNPLDLLAALTDHVGVWGEIATPEQWADAEAVLSLDGPRRHWI